MHTLITSARFVLAMALLLIVACGGESEPAGLGGSPPAATTGAAGPTALASPAEGPSLETPTPEAPTAEATADPSPTAPPAVSLTPRAVAEAELATARRLESEGNFAAATAIYVATATGGPAELRGEALLGAARLMLASDQPQQARAILEPFVATVAGRDLAGHYLLARSYAALELWQESVDQYELYLQSDRPAIAYAYLDRGRALRSLDRPAEAAASAEAGIALGLTAAAKRTFVLFTAESYEQAGALGTALAWYQRLLSTGTVADQALSLARIASIKRLQADPTAASDVQRLLAGYPTTAEALAELAAALARGEPVAPTVSGLIYYRHFDYTAAATAFAAQIGQAPQALASAEAYYYKAAIEESRGELEAALASYALAVQLNPGSPIADDALWWQGRILEDGGKHDEAAGLFAQIVTAYPNSTWASAAAFRRGLIPYREGLFGAASAAWDQRLTVVTDAGDRGRLALWQGKATLKDGDQGLARSLLEPLTIVNEDDYTGIRALALLENRHEQPRATREAALDLSPAFDWQAAEAWLSLRTGAAIGRVWSGDRRWTRALELWLVGRVSEGDDEAFGLIEAYAGNAVAMYTLARDLEALGRAGLSARAGQRLLRVLNANPRDGLPRALLSLSYPAAFSASVQRHSASAGISPLLLLAFVRQESFFDPRAESGAGALGLSQVLPTTGRTIAATLGVGDYDADKLLSADFNLRFGASYMASQLAEFDEELFVALAAYNAGPAAARRWRAAAGTDADLFLETVEFTETRLYVQFVAENYAIYRYLYGGETAPTLPP